jgi:hypothetical protein
MILTNINKIIIDLDLKNCTVETDCDSKVFKIYNNNYINLEDLYVNLSNCVHSFKNEFQCIYVSDGIAITANMRLEDECREYDVDALEDLIKYKYNKRCYNNGLIPKQLIQKYIPAYIINMIIYKPIPQLNETVYNIKNLNRKISGECPIHDAKYPELDTIDEPEKPEKEKPLIAETLSLLPSMINGVMTLLNKEQTKERSRNKSSNDKNPPKRKTKKPKDNSEFQKNVDTILHINNNRYYDSKYRKHHDDAVKNIEKEIEYNQYLADRDRRYR